MKNSLTDLNNHLFAQIERLGDEDLSGEDLEKEINRCDAITKVAKTIIESGNLSLQAKKHMDEYGKGEKIKMPLLGTSE